MLQYRSEIDGLRAIAIGCVVLFHAGSSVFTGGYVGVDIFFVISGFLITSIISREISEGRFSFWSFYARRARRILPALFFLLAVLTPVCFALLLPTPLVEYGKVLIYTVLFGANLRLAAAWGYFEAWSSDNPLLHMWSLAVEEQFYFVWPALLWLMASRFPRKLVLATALLALLSLVCSEVVLRFWPSTAFYHLPSRGWELLAGALVALKLFPPLQNRKFASALSLGGLALMLGSAVLYSKATSFPGLAALPPVLGCALVIYAETGAKTLTGKILSLRPFVFLGGISYSLYLWHWPFLALPVAVLARDLSPLESAFFVTLALGMSVFSWRYVERPFRRGSVSAIPADAYLSLLQRIAPRRNARAYFATAIAALLIIPGSYFQASQGAPWRLSAAEAALLNIGDIDCPLGTQQLTECKIGKTRPDEPGAFVLWGDSHARRYFPALAQIYETGTGFFYPGCMPIMNIIWVDALAHPISSDCDKTKEQAWAAIKKLRPKVVFLAGRWSVIEGPYGLEKTYIRFCVNSTHDEPSISRCHEVFSAEIRNTVRQLNALGAKVVVMAQVPEMKRNVRGCFISAIRLGLDTAHCHDVPRKDVEQRQAFINKTLSELEAENPNVTVFWPLPRMCDAEKCYAIKNGKLLYFDGDHINADGASTLKDAITETLVARRNADAPRTAAAYRGVSD